MAAEVAKKQAVEEALRQRSGKKQKGAPVAAAPERKPAPVSGVKKASGFDSLLSQIEAEKQRIEEQKKQAGSAGSQRTGAPKDAGRKGGKKGGRKEQVVPELEAKQVPSEDRYAQMAVQAEKLQRD